MQKYSLKYVLITPFKKLDSTHTDPQKKTDFHLTVIKVAKKAEHIHV